MTVQRDTLLCRYHYDPLDRIANCATPTQSSVQRFYRKDRLATEMQGQVQYSVFEHEAQLLAQQRHEAGRMATALLVTDLQRSVLHSVAAGQQQRLAYSPYGHRAPESGWISLLGFNGERRDSVTGHYLLGNGYRAFSPVLMRFNSPDSLSPFGKGGVNAYAYSLGDPVNLVDPMGRFAILASMVNQLASAPLATFRRFGKGLAAFKKDVKRSFTSAPEPVRPGHGPLTSIESGRDGFVAVKPMERSVKVSEALGKADELNLYNLGVKYRRAARPVAIQQERALKSQRFVEANGLPDYMKYKFPTDYLESLSALQLAEKNLGVAVLGHVLQSPGELMTTASLVGMIRTV